MTRVITAAVALCLALSIHAIAQSNNAGVSGSEIDCHVGGEGGHQAHGSTTSFAERERVCIRAQFMNRSHSLSAPNLKSYSNLCRACQKSSHARDGELQSCGKNTFLLSPFV